MFYVGKSGRGRYITKCSQKFIFHINISWPGFVSFFNIFVVLEE